MDNRMFVYPEGRAEIYNWIFELIPQRHNLSWPLFMAFDKTKLFLLFVWCSDLITRDGQTEGLGLLLPFKYDHLPFGVPLSQQLNPFFIK